MTTYYVGKGGNDGNAGTSWADRKLTLNGAEDIPVVAGDLVIVGPGVYRETLTVDVSGGAGNLIAYEGDWIGHRTDGVGGAVRVTGSDDDQAITRASCVDATAAKRDYRSFIGFTFDMVSGRIIDVGGGDGSDGWVVEDCTFQDYDRGIYCDGANGDSADDWEIRRCCFIDGQVGEGIYSYTLWGDHNENWVVEDCLLLFPGIGGVNLHNTDTGSVIRNCTVHQRYWGPNSYCLRFSGTVADGDINNSIVFGGSYGLYMINNVDYDYNWAHGCALPLFGGTDGGHNTSGPSTVIIPMYGSPDLLTGGFMMPWREWWVPDNLSAAKQDGFAGSSSSDFFGKTRPVTTSKITPGAVQWVPKELEQTTVYEGSGSNREDDAGRQQFWVQAEAASHTLTCRVYREANYAGSNPQIRIIQPGQTTIEIVDAGAAGAWNELTHTWTPAASPPWFVVELVSRNTNGGADGTLWDNLFIQAD